MNSHLWPLEAPLEQMVLVVVTLPLGFEALWSEDLPFHRIEELVSSLVCDDSCRGN